MDKTSFPQRLTEERKQRGCTQKQVAEALGVSDRTYSKWETGENEMDVSTCNGFVYSMGGAILDIDEPSKVLYRCANYLLTPEEPYEVTGFVPNVVFPCATLQDGDTGRIAIYYGAADTHVGLAFTTADQVVNYIKEHSVLHSGDDEAVQNY